MQTARPRQWPKNLLVFAAPLAGASLGRDDGLGYALAAAAAFTAAAAAVYFVNDVLDADRDRRHPVKRLRAVASGRLPRGHALAVAVLSLSLAEAGCLWLDEDTLALLVFVYFAVSLLYSAALKHLPVVELVFVASGFVLRALGGASATRVPPSGWFLAGVQPGRADGGDRQAVHRAGRARPARGPAPPGDALVPGRLAAAGPAGRLGRHDHRLPVLGGRPAGHRDPGRCTWSARCRWPPPWSASTG